MATDDDDPPSPLANLRAAFDVWPPGQALPSDAEDVARAALTLLLGDLLADRGAAVSVARFAHDGVSVWRLDGLDGLALEDLVRAIAGVFEPAAYAVAVVQPMRKPGDPKIRGVHCRAAFGDDLVEMTGDVAGAGGPPAGRSVRRWTVRNGHATDDRGRWIGVPPTVDVPLPMVGAAES